MWKKEKKESSKSKRKIKEIYLLLLIDLWTALNQNEKEKKKKDEQKKKRKSMGGKERKVFEYFAEGKLSILAFCKKIIMRMWKDNWILLEPFLWIIPLSFSSSFSQIKASKKKNENIKSKDERREVSARAFFPAQWGWNCNFSEILKAFLLFLPLLFLFLPTVVSFRHCLS